MTRKSARRIVLIGIAITFLGVVAALVIAVAGGTGRVRIVNNAAERILNGHLEICRQHFALESIEKGQAVLVKYRVRGDSHYTLRVMFESGSTLEKELGYVTNGMDFDDELVVEDSTVKLTSTHRMRY